EPPAALDGHAGTPDLEPDKGSVRGTLARAYFQAGRYSAATDGFARAVELDPTNDYAHFGLGLCLLRTGQRVEARGHLRLAVAMRPLDLYRETLARLANEL